MGGRKEGEEEEKCREKEKLEFGRKCYQFCSKILIISNIFIQAKFKKSVKRVNIQS